MKKQIGSDKNMKRRRSNWDRVKELNEILGNHPKFHFSLIQNYKEHRHPYCLAWNCCGAVEHSLSFREMKQLAIKLHAEACAQ